MKTATYSAWRATGLNAYKTFSKMHLGRTKVHKPSAQMVTKPESPIKYQLDKHSPERDLKITDEYWEQKGFNPNKSQVKNVDDLSSKVINEKNS